MLWSKDLTFSSKIHCWIYGYIRSFHVFHFFLISNGTEDIYQIKITAVGEMLTKLRIYIHYRLRPTNAVSKLNKENLQDVQEICKPTRAYHCHCEDIKHFGWQSGILEFSSKMWYMTLSSRLEGYWQQFLNNYWKDITIHTVMNTN